MNAQEVRFPRLNELEKVRQVHHPDIIVSSNLAQLIIDKSLEYCQSVPVIVVG